MASVFFPATPVYIPSGPNAGEPATELRGASVWIVHRDTEAWLNLSYDAAGLEPMSQPIVVTGLGYLPPFHVQEGIVPTAVKSGTLPLMPIASPEGVLSAAEDIQAAMVALANDVETSVFSDSDVATLIATPASGTRIALDGLYNKTLTGTYAARPAANTVLAGTIYDCTNVPESYRSNGTVWSVRPSGGTELGYAQSVVMYETSSTTYEDIPGLTTTFIAGERPVECHFGGVIYSSVAGGWGYVQLVLDGTVIGAVGGFAGPNAGSFEIRERSIRKSGLTPGTTHTFKAQVACYSPASPNQGVTRVLSSATNPSEVWVTTT